MRNGRALADVLVDFVLQSLDGLGRRIKATILRDAVVLLKKAYDA